MKRKISNLMQSLAECQAACNHCFNACLEEKDVNMMVNCIRQDKECAEVCIIASSLIASNSELCKEILHLCISACEACEKECRKHSNEHCWECAEACHNCAKACMAYA